TVDFYEYCKNVLPNEWGASWGSESLKAGAMCVKMVGWFRVESAKYPGRGYDVKDTDADQVYKPNSAKTSCTNAIKAIGSTGIQSASYLFFPRYLSGTEGYYEVGGWDGGTVSQWGTKKFADNGYDYLHMLHYYYDYTPRLDGNVMYTFTY
ncbi:MAG: SpoIID/LytB domain-containing protein, partial [Aminipila sp.]